MLANTTISVEKDEDIAKGVRFDNPQSQFAPDGMVSPLTGNKTINSRTTQDLNIQNYRMGKFMREFSKTGFDGLQEVTQPNGDTAWVMNTAIDNQDFNFYLLKSEILSTVTLEEVKNEQQIKATASKYNIKDDQTYITIDGKKYFTRMNVPLRFGTGQNNDSWINIGVFVVGGEVVASAIAAVIASLGFDAFKKALGNIQSALMKSLWALVKGVTKAIYRFVASFIGELVGGGTVEAALAVARKAAGDAWAESVEGVTSKTLRYTVVGVIIIVALFLIIEFVLHESYQNVYVYNLTGYDISLDFPYKNEGNDHNLPSSKVLAKVDQKGPGGIDLGEWYNGVAFRYQSDSEFYGLGYTMRFKMIDPKTQEVKKTFSCLFDVPYSGDNSLYASTGEPSKSDYKAYYSRNAGSHKITQYSANDGEQEIIVSYDYLNGKHPDPETGKDLYLYSSLVVIRDIA
jgi:hypothetical protein